tara:strand:+ start:5391 stop:5570 length:180 start_codon:yes stop_codon:yes gene_type:complete
MFDIKPIDLILHIKDMREKAHVKASKAERLSIESAIIFEEAGRLEEELKDNLIEHGVKL